MYVITATFDVDQAQARIAELLALGDSPERLAEKLGTPRDLEQLKEGVPATSFKQLVSDVTRLRNFLDLDVQIEKLKNEKSMLRFLGSGFKNKQVAKLEEERSKFGTLMDGPRWFYQQPRVRLLSAIRDYALDGSQLGNAVWVEMDEKALAFPVVAIFQNADVEAATALAAHLEKPLKEIDPRFLLEKFEGHRSISFDLDHGTTLYYTPAPSPTA
jgi:hypothetical protein